ncbi:zinc ABC transporter substrate-binding protein ZnuA [Rhizobium oryzicola]|uniref:High-affinity zinc uptake system protein ZnuA n=1 Tax=Rhizobium oryzicola TaxID=1232668 RepID=A0ABT8T125_9HYPH|nr:zinc ABC transporter substrate-binding protein ZnuA [Rhizobium oryzicola]MDO1584365.1 zinc ABC transporter substrate-binding protein ZnuA [Rhizobium oryzicola]
MKSAAAILLASSFAAAAPATAAPDVVVSIKPLHSLVAAVMNGVAEPALIVDGSASPHTYNLKPSNARTLQNADLVFWVGPNMEAFLERPLQALSKDSTVVALEHTPGLKTLPMREGGTFEPHADDDDHDAHAEAHDHDHAHGEEHEHEGIDTHLWLDPQNAKVLVQEIERRLIAVDPANIAVYNKNTMAVLQKIDALDADIKKTVEPIKTKPFIVFHDAYQYFENRYHVTVAGSVTVSPEVAPGADRVRQIHEKLQSLGAACIFAEPQFTPKILQTVSAGTSAKTGVLDPEGANLKAGPNLYFELMQNLASSLNECLSRAS